MGFKATETIAQPVSQVWDVATDWKRTPEWMKGIDEMRPLGEGPVGEGTELAFTSRGAERRSTIVGWVPGVRMALRSVQGGITADYEYLFMDRGKETVVTLSAECKAQGLLWRALAPAIGFLMARSDGGQIRALKRMIEGPAD